MSASPLNRMNYTEYVKLDRNTSTSTGQTQAHLTDTQLAGYDTAFIDVDLIETVAHDTAECVLDRIAFLQLRRLVP